MCEQEDEKKGSDVETVDWMIWALTFLIYDFGSILFKLKRLLLGLPRSPLRRSCFAKSRVELRGSQDHIL